MSTTTTPAFRGWWRPNRRTAWTRLAEGATYDAALAELLTALAGVKGGDSIVTRADADPNRPAPKHRQGGRRMQ